MCKLFDDWSSEIKRYCDSNALDFEKAKKMSQCWGKDFVALQYHDAKKGQKGLLNDTPMPLVLLISKGKTGLDFEQTEYTKKYLA
ncbi:MAG: hypothetical protein IJU56_00080 [Clostridia bacterium]|nr:hypothetical protein [Clostridia bacterium]